MRHKTKPPNLKYDSLIICYTWNHLIVWKEMINIKLNNY